MKKFLIIIGVIAVVFVGGGAILYFNLEKIVNSKKDYILERAEAELGREVTVGSIGVTLGRGIGVRLSDVGIADDPAFSNDKFVQAKDLTVRVKLLPLFRKKVEVKRLVLNEPVITIVRNKDGVFNYESLNPIQKAKTARQDSIAPGAETRAQPAGRPAASAAPAAAIPLVMAFADIKDGTIQFADRASGLDLTVRQINLTVENFGLKDEVSIDFGAAVLAEKEDFTLEGRVGPIGDFQSIEDIAGVPLTIKIGYGPIEIQDVRKVLPALAAWEQIEALEIKSINGGLELAGTIGAIEVSQVNLSGTVLGADKPNLSLSAQAGLVNKFEDGKLVPSAEKISGNFELSPVSMARLLELPSVKAAVPPEFKAAGDASVKAGFEGNLESMSLELVLDMADGSVELADKFKKPAGVPLGVTARLAASKTALEIKDSRLTLGDFAATAAGKVSLGGEKPEMSLKVTSSKNDLSRLAGLVPVLAQFAVQGLLSLDADVSGPVGGETKPKVSGTLALAGGSAKIEQMPGPVTGLGATVKFTDDNARLENTSFKVGRSEVRVAGEAPRLKPMTANYKVTSKEAFRADFQVPPAKPGPRTEVLKDVALEGRIWQEGETVQLTGTASSSRGILANVDYQDLQASIKSTEDKILIERFSAKSLDGTIEGSGTFEPKQVPPRFNLTTKVRRINLAEYFRYKVASLPQLLEGRIDVDLNLAGTGKDWEEIQPSLEGGGGAVVIDGALLNVNLAEELLAGLSQIPMVEAAGLNRIRQKYPDLFSTNKTVFQNLKGKVEIYGGKVHSGDLELRAKDFVISGNGWFSFDKKMDMNTNVVLSAKMTQEIIKELAVAKYIVNNQGRIEIPVILRGDVVKPKFILDADALTSKIQSSALQQGVDELKGQLKDKAKDLFSGFGKKKAPAKKDTTGTR